VRASSSFHADALKTFVGVVLGLLPPVMVLGGFHLVKTGSLLSQKASDERCAQLWHDPDGSDEETGEPSAQVDFGLSCDDRGSEHSRHDGHLRSAEGDRLGAR
jgi:hypothetical protein